MYQHLHQQYIFLEGRDLFAHYRDAINITHVPQ